MRRAVLGVVVLLLSALPLRAAGAISASSLAGWRGTAAFRPARRQPERPLELYEFE